MSGLVTQFTFFAGCLARTPFRDQVRAAAKAGFDSISIWPNIWRHAVRKDGLTLHDMRAMLEDHGLKLTDVDACRDWAPSPNTTAGSAFGPVASRASRHEFFETCCALGGTTVVAVHLTDAPLDLDRDTAGFASLCDDATAHGLRVALEFVPFGNIPDVATAMRIVDGAGRANGGLVIDLLHHARSGFDNGALAKVPADRIYTVQFCDAPALPVHSLADEAVYHRGWPGEGQLDIRGFLQLLDRIGARASIGLELYKPEFEHRDADAVARQLADAARAAFAEAQLSLPSDPHC